MIDDKSILTTLLTSTKMVDWFSPISSFERLAGRWKLESATVM